MTTEATPRPAQPSPYDDAALYDLVMEGLRFDIDFWIATARAAQGPVLELGCGTGRVLLPMIEAGIDADGLDLTPAMIDRLREKARARGLDARVQAGDMREFTMPRHYAAVFCPFNAFAHNLTADDQLRTLRCCREHLEPGGAFVVHLGLPSPTMWMEQDGEPVLEIETTDPATGRAVRLYDRRFKNPVTMTQHSKMEIQILDGERLVASHLSETDQRWVGLHELELLFRLAGFARWQIFGGFAREPIARDTNQMIAFAWKS